MKKAVILSLLILIIISGCIFETKPNQTTPKSKVKVNITIPESKIEVEEFPPSVVNVDVSPNYTYAYVTWNTDKPCTCELRYGEASGEYTNSLKVETEPSTDHEVEIVGLSPGVTYFFNIICTDEHGNVTESEEYFFTTQVPPKPEISNIHLDIGFNNATVFWDTDKPCTGEVLYGRKEELLIFSSKNESFSTKHSLAVKNLEPGKMYFFKIISTDELGSRTESEIYNFTTLARLGDSVEKNGIEVKVEDFDYEATPIAIKLTIRNCMDYKIAVNIDYLAIVSEEGMQYLPNEKFEQFNLYPRAYLTQEYTFSDFRSSGEYAMFYITINGEEYVFKLRMK